MKRLILFTILIFTMLFCVNAHAEKQIEIHMFGNKITCDVPPVIENDRTLVPARAISEEGMGADVTWSGRDKQVTIIKDKKVVKLTIGKKDALVDGEKITMDVAAKIIEDRTFVPLRFVGEAFNYDVQWDGEKRRVTIEENAGKIENIDVEETANDNLLNIKLSKYEEPDVFTLKEPYRIVLDFKGTKFDGDDGKLNINSGFITQVRWADHDGYYRVVIECPGKQPHQLVQTGHDKFSIIVGSPETKVDTSKKDDNYKDDNKTDDKTDDSNDDNTETEKKPLDREGPMKNPSGKGPLVVIDAGHGGKDPGALAKDEEGKDIYIDDEPAVREKDVNLSVALKTYKFLKNEGINVMMTRDDDEFIELRDIANIANDAEATLFVSIHCNSVDGVSTANGTEVLYYNTEEKSEYGISSEALAKEILLYMVDVGDMLDRGLKERPGLAVLKWTDMPAALVELGFLTNPEDTEKLTDPTWQQDAAWGIAQGIKKALKKI